MLLCKVLSVVLKHEDTILDAHARLRGACIIRVLQQLRDNMTRALYLLE